MVSVAELTASLAAVTVGGSSISHAGLRLQSAAPVGGVKLTGSTQASLTGILKDACAGKESQNSVDTTTLPHSIAREDIWRLCRHA